MKMNIPEKAKSLSAIIFLVSLLLFSAVSSAESIVAYRSTININVYQREILHPDGTGNSTWWKPIPAIENWKCVNQSTSDEDSTYVVASSTSVLKDLYSLQNHTIEDGKISSVTVHIRCRASALLSGQSPPVSILIIENSREYESNQFGLTTSYADYSKTYSLNPANGQTWTLKDIDELQVGIKGNGISSNGFLAVVPSPTPSSTPAPTPSTTASPSPTPTATATPTATPVSTATPAPIQPIQFAYPRCTQIWVQINYQT